MKAANRKPLIIKCGMLMLIIIVTSLATDLVNLPQAKAEPLSERRVAYQIDVKLDPQAKQLTGSEKITWSNPGQKPVSELYLHLYPNAFQKGSTFVNESGGTLRGDKMDVQSPGSMEITSVTMSDGTRLLHNLSYVQPDDGNKKDKTLARLRLPEPVNPGENLVLYLDFVVQLPKVFARMGYSGDFVMAGQWFPKLAVYEVVGQRGQTEERWNAHQYHAHSEFYADYGTYDVTITVPENYQVAATGRMTQSPLIKDGWQTRTYWAGDVHDFAWSASPNFIVAERNYGNLGEKGITVQLYLDPNHQEASEKYFQVMEQTMTHFDKWFGKYPYDTLSIVVPPPGASGAAGMEYPTLITAWDASVPTSGLAIEQVVVHELAHQYWYGLVGSNEFEEPWLDEGFATYSENKMMSVLFPDYMRYTLLQPILKPMPLNLAAWEFNESTYASNVYMRAGRVLKGIEEIIGEQTMMQVIRTYFEQYQFKHPSTEDFLAVLNQVSGKNFHDFFQRFVYQDHMVDYRVTHIERVPAKESGTYETRVNLEAVNSIGQQVEVLLLYADGQIEKRLWNTKDNPASLTVSGPPLDAVWIDPQSTSTMEIYHINNQRRFISDEMWQTWTHRIHFWLESMLRWIVW